MVSDRRATLQFTASVAVLLVDEMQLRPTIARFIDSKTSLPLNATELQGPSRRLLKARHHDIDKMDIQTKSLTATLQSKAIKFTVYKVQICSTARFANTVKWTIVKRYSEFFNFRQTLLKHMETWDRQFGDDARRLQCKELTLAKALLLPALQIPDFPRKHLRCDTDIIVKERRKKLQQFVREGHASDAHQLGRYSEHRRCAILVATVLDLETRLTDAVLDIADKLIGGLFAKARNAARRRYAASASDVGRLMRLFHGTIEALAAA